MLRAFVLLLVASALAPAARAQQPPVTEIWKCRNAEGHWTYTNDRNEAEKQKCEIVTRQVNVAPAPPKPAPPAAKGARPSDFPKETANDRASARERQREVLEKELATEQTALAKAKDELAAQEAVRSGDERNYARVEERLQPYKDSVETHEKNIEALRRELNNLYR
jgi:septal ring factor EnvC (AmiA/AmiB activator)